MQEMQAAVAAIAARKRKYKGRPNSASTEICVLPGEQKSNPLASRVALLTCTGRCSARWSLCARTERSKSAASSCASTARRRFGNKTDHAQQQIRTTPTHVTGFSRGTPRQGVCGKEIACTWVGAAIGEGSCRLTSRKRPRRGADRLICWTSARRSIDARRDGDGRSQQRQADVFADARVLVILYRYSGGGCA